MLPRRIALLIPLAVMAARLPAQKRAAPAPSHSTAWTEEVIQDFGDSDASKAGIPTFHSTARLVVLDVVVTDGYGHAIKGLKQSDFTLLEDGVPQRLASFTEHDAAAEALPAETAGPPLAPNTFAVQPPITGDRVRTVIVLGSLSFWNAPQVRYDLKGFVKNVAPGNAIAIFKGDCKGLHLVQDFTADPRVLQEAANSKRILPPLGSCLPSEARPMNTRGLARYLSAIPGRINLIWISDGGAPVGEITSEFPDVSGLLHDLNGATNVLKLSRIAVYPIDANGVTVPLADQMWGPPTSNPEPALFNFGTSPFGQDPYLLFADADLGDKAAATGGKMFYNNNDYKNEMAEVVETGSHYYTISYAPTNRDWDGAMRHIHITVPDGLVHETLSEKIQDMVEQPQRLEYRNYYYARNTPDATPDGLQNGAAAQQRKLISYSPAGDPGGVKPSAIPPVQAAMALGTAAPDALHFTVTAMPAAEIERPKPGEALPRGNYLAPAVRDQPYRNVGLHFSLTPQELQMRESGGVHRDALEVIAVLYRDDGVEVNSFVRKVSIAVDASTYTKLMSAPIEITQNIAIPVADHYYLRTAIREAPTERIGALEVPTEWIKIAPQTTAAHATAAP